MLSDEGDVPAGKCERDEALGAGGSHVEHSQRLGSVISVLTGPGFGSGYSTLSPVRQQSGGPIIIGWQHKNGVGLFSFDLVNGVCSALSGAAQFIRLFGISDPTAIRYCAGTGPLKQHHDGEVVRHTHRR